MVGLSPRVRGSHRVWRQNTGRYGSIPACAGEPAAYLARAHRSKVYPRVCGGAPLEYTELGSGGGLSPRVRGSLTQEDDGLSDGRSIPACAGEPRSSISYIAFYLGLSPRVRGSPTTSAYNISNMRSIPACAGEPMLPPACMSISRVYPRVCGGAKLRYAAHYRSTGLSPRVRGSLYQSPPNLYRSGSIPACAGEPVVLCLHPLETTVYPRVCGGARGLCHIRLVEPGLSPRVRGSPLGNWENYFIGISIPACAGEPTCKIGFISEHMVYSRVCGGAIYRRGAISMKRGLSPRVRGSPLRLDALSRNARSIPACAGEPGVGVTDEQIERVYPRVCGGARLT